MSNQAGPGRESREAEADAFFASMLIECRKDIVAGLLAGNDAQCFSTDQYRAAYVRAWPPSPPVPGLTLQQAERHLRDLARRGAVREVGPDVWAGPAAADVVAPERERHEH